MSCRIFKRLCLLVIAQLMAGRASAQVEDLTLPPRIDEAAPQTLPPQSDDAAPPQARLATPTDDDRNGAMEEVLVVRENPWRLPDLGSEWRARQQSERQTGRISAEMLPLFDPEAEPPIRDLFPLNREMQRVGFIELFRIRFGER